jgi:hypothetical protein
MDAFDNRRRGHRAIASAGCEGQAAAESFFGIVRGDGARSIRAIIGGKRRTVEGGEKACERLDAESAGSDFGAGASFADLGGGWSSFRIAWCYGRSRFDNCL